MTKVLKQNGAGGKIIRAQGSGKVLKQNYNFGKTLKHQYRLKANIAELLQNHDTLTIMCIVKLANPRDDTDLVRIFNDLDETVLEIETYNKIIWSRTPSSTTAYNLNSGSEYGEPLFGSLTLNKNNWTQRNNLTKYTSNDNKFESFLSSTLKDVYLVYDSAVNFSTNRVIFLNRELTDNEWLYFYNNKLGNELLNTLGIIADFNFIKAEILNINGSDVVGVRNQNDTGDGHHAEFVSLPVGTLQEQLDFANNNLFNLW